VEEEEEAAAEAEAEEGSGAALWTNKNGEEMTVLPNA
jgi:hypothetical protein